MAYEINYNDSRFQQVNNEKANALNKVNSTYNEMMSNSDQNYQAIIDASKDYATQQQQFQQQQTDFAIEKVDQQKEQAEKDYQKEQKASYVDYQKVTNQYGANAEAMASQGMTNTGYSESSRIQAFTTYQNRYATARESYNRAVLEFENAKKEYTLANNSKLAEIAYNALQTQLETTLQQFQYKNTLLQAQLEAQRQTENDYYTRWQNVLSQMNTENSLAEQIRQYNESMAYQKQRDAIEDAQWQKQFNASYGGSSGSSSTRLTNGSSGSKSGSGGSASLSDGGSGTDNYGNSKTTQSKEDYYFSNGYQPQYINNKKISASGLKVYNVFNEGTSSKNATTFGKQNIWSAGGKYYVWDGSIKDYVDVTAKVKTSQKNRVNFEWGR